MSLIPPSLAWNVQIEVTSKCIRACSNCTRMSSIRSVDAVMTPEQFRTACRNLSDFPSQAPPAKYCREPRCIGMIGGEPTIHPQFEELTRIFKEEVPEHKYRGLWTGLPTAKWDKVKEGLRADYGYINHNIHTPPSYHSPILVASGELLPDKEAREKWTNECWLNHIWSPIVTPDGVYFCEVAATIDKLFNLGVALPDEPGWWRDPIETFADQIEACCKRCGVAMPLPGRFDNECMDDISPQNLLDLEALQGHTCCLRNMQVFEPAGYDPKKYLNGWAPAKYIGRQ